MNDEQMLKGSELKILLVEDDVKISRYLVLELEHEGYRVETVHDGIAALDSFTAGSFDLILLDLMLPGLSGIEVCRRIRKTSEVPVVMLTAKDSTTDKVIGLDFGADDYLTKPFEIEELFARIRSVIRRKRTDASSEHETYRIGDLVMDVDKKQVTRSGKEISLTKREFELLAYLLENQDIVISRESLLEHVWKWESAGETNTVDVYIRYLRDKIDKGFDSPLIHTVRGFGYVLKTSS